ncbi:MAG: hypothetical protein NTY01_08595 [Verrucomicrobia bacterium]|nr:hypothetical protein [Verrucomicrobiota bacterium]
MNNLLPQFAAAVVVAAIGPTSFAAEPDAPLLFCIGVHVEPMGATPSALVGDGARRLPPRPGPDYNREPFFRRHVADLQALAAIAEKHGGKMTVQAQTPFTSMSVKTGERILAGFEKRGHEIALHFHEDTHLGRNGGSLPAGTWTAVMKEEIEWIKKAGATRVRYWSGGNLYLKVLNAAAGAGLDVMSDHKNPRVQRTFPELLSIHPWRPAGGPTADDIAAFAKHDPTGKIIYLPDGIFTRTDFNSMRRTEFAGSDAKYFDFLADSLRASLKAARADRVNVFHITVHAGEFRGGPDAEKPFGVIDRWLTDAVDPLVKAGKVKWATFSEMADAFCAWENKNPGVDPRAAAKVVTAPASTVAEPPKGGTPNQFSRRDLAVTNPTSDARLWAQAVFPADASAQKRYPAVVFVHGGMSYGSQPMHAMEAEGIARAGFVVVNFDPDGRGKSEGWENWNGKVHQDGLHAVLKAVAALDIVDASNVGVVSSSLGLAMAAGTLGRYPNDPPVKYFIDIEGPTDRFYITKNDDPGFGRLFGGRTTADADWWVEREAVRTIPNMLCPYLRLQWESDHVHGPNKGHAIDIINAATNTKHGGKGKSPWTRVNGPENEPNRTYAIDKPPKWFSGRQGRGQAGSTLQWIREMADANKPADKASNHESRVTNHASITFAVNTHDWPHLDESAATVLRLVAIFERNKVRGDFYFTPQIVEHYEQKRPDVIQRLKQSGMCISYHVRPPHPTYGGFEGRLRDLDDAALAKTLRDYETYRLDPATGELQRNKPGGYTYVAKVFGRKPVVVSPQCRDPRIRAAALKVYAELGAKMVVAYHESGTKLEQPFEWVQGLLARPSDFSITRWGVGGRQEVFWWNMLDAPNAAEFNPTERLKNQLAAWKGSRPPFITALIHENDFSRSGTGWSGIYLDGEGRNSRPKQPPFDLNAPDPSRPRTAEARERIWKTYEAMVAHAAANLRVVTSEDIVAMAAGRR